MLMVVLGFIIGFMSINFLDIKPTFKPKTILDIKPKLKPKTKLDK
jgi:hypothetical protein